ncbi:DUF2829 domain-containing protein [Dysgonomonas sp. Marseille-P4677]|uniref:DUF2829 domain-containing protein n=1 Tax=Dysgonomonas sp. Marseille-P4677 TaxID=2364790 RepID=UPI001912EAF5|nr:DUF2829 domain-containing protein [Dysgonomonas sp. Marseille-P4677]MBK5721326.1 DUF2829 domain-containing protein [Dysgonomonas sp. Marseille-P4677]
MKTLDEKSAEYSAKLCNQSGNYSKGELETAYCQGATENAKLTKGEFGTFGQALESIKHGFLVTRKGWNGKGMFIFMRPADEIRVDIVVNSVKSLPYAVKEYFKQDIGDTPANDIPATDVVKFTAYLCMKAADGTIVNGWLASQTDMLSEDWMLFNF